MEKKTGIFTKIVAYAAVVREAIMAASKNKYFLLGLAALLMVYNYVSIFLNKAVLAGDSAYLYNSLYNPALRTTPFFELLYGFLNSSGYSSSPISGTIYGLFIYFAQYGAAIYFLLYGFFLLSLWALFHIVAKLGNSYTAFLITVLYALLPIGTTVAFMPMMGTESMAMAFYIFSLYWVVVRKSLWVSALFFVLSILCYESFLPLLFLNLLLMNEPKKRKWIYGLSLGAVFLLYRFLVAPKLFPQHSNPEHFMNVFNIGRDVFILQSIPVLFWDFILGMVHGVGAVRYYGWTDWLVLLLFFAIITIIIKNTSRSRQIARRVMIKYSAIGFGLSFILFFISDDVPSLMQYNSHTLGAVRLGFAVFLYSAVVRFTDKRAVRGVLVTLIMLFAITTISVKNAWVFAADTNKGIMNGIKKKLPARRNADVVFFTYDSTKSLNTPGVDNLWAADVEGIFDDGRIIFQEPVMFMNDEMLYPQNYVGLDPKLKVCYYFTREAQGYNVMPDRYYIYDYRSNTMRFFKK